MPAFAPAPASCRPAAAHDYCCWRWRCHCRRTRSDDQDRVTAGKLDCFEQVVHRNRLPGAAGNGGVVEMQANRKWIAGTWRSVLITFNWTAQARRYGSRPTSSGCKPKQNDRGESAHPLGFITPSALPFLHARETSGRYRTPFVHMRASLNTQDPIPYHGSGLLQAALSLPSCLVHCDDALPCFPFQLTGCVQDVAEAEERITRRSTAVKNAQEIPTTIIPRRPLPRQTRDYSLLTIRVVAV